MDAMSGGLNSQPALDQYSKQFRDMPDAAIRGVGDAVASIPDMAIAAGKLAMEGGFNPRMGQSERVKRFANTTYMPINPMMQDALTRAGVAETEGGNNLTRFVSGAMAPYAMGKYAGAVGDAIGAAERRALSNAERGMFAGVGAKNADLKALKVAEKLEADGVDKDVIWGQTGWGRGVDNKWRFEIDDSKAILNDSLDNADGLGVGGVISHPDVKANYSQTDNLSIDRMRQLGGNTLPKGSYNRSILNNVENEPYMPSIVIDAKDAGRAKDIGLHEIQHNLQDLENFGHGGSPINAFSFSGPDSATSLYKQMRKDIRKPLTLDDYVQKAWGGIKSEFAVRDYDLYLKSLKKPISANIDRTLQETAAREWYRRQSGEVEARNVQTRMNMTPAERLLTPPWKTEDVARDKQIVRFGGGKSMSLPTDDLPMTGGIPTKSDLIKARQIVEDAAKRHGLEMSPTAGGGEPGWGGGMTNSKYASFRASAPDGKKFTNIDVRVSDHGEPMKRLQSGYGSNLSFDGSQSLDEFAAKTNDLFSSVSTKYKPNDLPMDEASRIVTYRGSDLHPDILNAIKPIVGKKQRSQELSNIKKMQIPIEEMEAKRRLLPKRDLPVFDVNNIPTGSWLLGSPADAMKGAAELTEINGLKLKAPVRLDGGIDYAQMHKSPGWSSEKSAGTVWMNNVNKQLADGKDIWPSIVAMSARGTTSTKAMANLQTQRLANIEIPRRSADAMTKMLRGHKVSVKTDNGYRVTFPFKDAPSFRNQNEMAEYIDGLELTQRGRFFEALDRAKTLDEGVPNLIPDLASARFALADENQLGIPAGSSGMLITRMNRPMTMAEVLKGQEGYHPGYRYRQSGFDVAGKTDVSIPPQVFWKDAFQKIIDRGRSPKEAAIVLPRPKGGGPLLQEVTNEWKDLVSKVIEDNKKSGSGRNALLPLGAGGAGAISVDYDEEERKLKRDRKRK